MRAKARWLPADLPAECPLVAQVFAYSATDPASDAEYLVDDIDESDDFVSQAMLELENYGSPVVRKTPPLLKERNFLFKHLVLASLVITAHPVVPRQSCWCPRMI